VKTGHCEALVFDAQDFPPARTPDLPGNARQRKAASRRDASGDYVEIAGMDELVPVRMV
jgi:hypothetical protein